MGNVTFRTREGQDTKIDGERLMAFGGDLRGALLLPNAPEYDAARALWNGMIDKRPAAIVRCRGAADVAACVRFAATEGVLLSVKGGGHNIAGNALADGGLTIDLSLMQSVRIDPGSRTARVEPGVTLGSFDREAQAFGLATPLGINSTTGVAGLTLGGGFGWTSRSLGLTIDNLLSADVVTANGELVRASERENADLFWGIRGGGGNFGVVTSFEFRLHALGPQVLSGLVVHPLDDAPQVLRSYRSFTSDSPDELATWFVMRLAPPLPFLPVEWHGKGILVLAMCYLGSLEDGERITRPLRSVGKPLADVVGPHPFTGWQTALDPLLTPGARNYWKSHDFLRLDDGLIDVFMDYARRIPDPQSEIAFAQLGGAVSRVGSSVTAYANREAQYLVNVHGRWDDPAKDEACVTWARQLYQAATPFATGGVYMNFLTQDESERVQAAYGPNFARLVELKQKVDPENLFSVNQNIRPGQKK